MLTCPREMNLAVINKMSWNGGRGQVGSDHEVWAGAKESLNSVSKWEDDYQISCLHAPVSRSAANGEGNPGGDGGWEER